MNKNNSNKQQKGQAPYHRLDNKQIMMLEISRVINNLQELIDYHDQREKQMYNERLSTLLEQLDHPSKVQMSTTEKSECTLKPNPSQPVPNKVQQRRTADLPQPTLRFLQILQRTIRNHPEVLQRDQIGGVLPRRRPDSREGAEHEPKDPQIRKSVIGRFTLKKLRIGETIDCFEK